MDFEQIRLMASGFQPSKLLLTALELGVFERLAEGPLGPGQLARGLGLDARATEIAANALVSLGLLELSGSGYGNAEPARRYLVRGSPEYRGDILRHLHAAWEDWEGLPTVWKAGRPALRRKDQALPSSDEGLRDFILGMENLTRELAPALAEKLPLAGCRTALDLGAGPGNYALAFVRRWPDLRVVHFDLGRTSRIAREFLRGREGAERISFREGDFLRDPLGEEFDFVWTSQIIHMLGEEEVVELLRRVADCLAPGGRVAVHDHFLDPGKASPRSAALFGVHMLVATEKGRTYSLEEVEGYARRVGLAPAGLIDYGGPSRVFLARRGE